MNDDTDTALFGVDVEAVLGDIEIVPAAWRDEEGDQ